MRAARGVRARRDNVGYVLIAPFFLFLLIFVLVPCVVNVLLSFTNYDMNRMDFIGLRNYRRMLTDRILQQSLVNTLFYTLLSLSLTIILGFFSATGLMQTNRWMKAYRTAIFLPYVISMAASSMIWLWMYDPANGFFNRVLSVLALPRSQWIYRVGLAMACLIVMAIWKFVGYNMVIFTAGLVAIPEELYEAAIIDGASAWRRTLHITIPMLWPVTFFLLVTGFINNFNVFEQVNILTKGGPMNSTTTIMHQVYIRAFIDYKMGYGASITVLLMAIVAVLAVLNFAFGSRGQDLDQT